MASALEMQHNRYIRSLDKLKEYQEQKHLKKSVIIQHLIITFYPMARLRAGHGIILDNRYPNTPRLNRKCQICGH